MPLLICLHCGSALTALDTATAPLRCPVCGATLSPAAEPDALPIREAEILREESHTGAWGPHDSERAGERDDEDISATRAVARERMEPIVAQVRTDHQQRQGALPSAPPAEDVTHALPASALPLGAQAEQVEQAEGAGREATQALPISAVPVETQHGGARPRPRLLSLALAALTLLVVVAVAALAANGVFGGLGATSRTPTATAQPAVTVTPNFAEPGLYQLTRPRDWLKQQRNSPPHSYYTLLTAPAGGVSVNIEVQQLDTPPALAMLDRQFITALARPGTMPINFSAPVSVTVGGQTWTQLTADAELARASGQPTTPHAHVAALSTQHGAYTYTIVCVATASTPADAGSAFTTANQAYFQPLLATFTFLR